MKISVRQHRWFGKEIEIEYRCDPVPNTGRRGCYGHYFRRPRTTQEKRFSCIPEDKKYIRGKRHFCNIPSCWDDIYTSLQRNWKMYRKTPYRKIASLF